MWLGQKERAVVIIYPRSPPPVDTHTHMYICMYIYKYICVYMYMCMHPDTYSYIYIYIFIYPRSTPPVEWCVKSLYIYYIWHIYIHRVMCVTIMTDCSIYILYRDCNVYKLHRTYTYTHRVIYVRIMTDVLEFFTYLQELCLTHNFMCKWHSDMSRTFMMYHEMYI